MAELSALELGRLYLEPIMNYVTFALDVIIILTILAIVTITIINLLRIFISHIKKNEEETKQRPERVRIIVTRMLRGLLIALDFLVATDIIESILAPSIFQLAQLGFVVVIRILLSWSLSKEIESR